jgi:hypothetical protein
MSAPFILEHGIYGPRVTVTGRWTPAIAEYMRQKDVRELYLNYARGWNGTSLDFVATLPDLVAFTILDFTIADVTPIHQLAELRALEVSTYCTTPIDFHRFVKLETCNFYWRAGSESLFSRKTLRRLFLHRYAESGSEPFARLSELEELSIANSELREVEQLAALKQLRFLGLYNLNKLASLRGLEKLLRLETLEVNGCKSLGRIDEVAALVNLRRLQLNDDGRIASLAPLRSAVDLEDVLFYESTNIVDGDLTPLVSLPRLRHTAFQNRRHYTHRRESLALGRAVDGGKVNRG